MGLNTEQDIKAAIPFYRGKILPLFNGIPTMQVLDWKATTEVDWKWCIEPSISDGGVVRRKLVQKAEIDFHDQGDTTAIDTPITQPAIMATQQSRPIR